MVETTNLSTTGEGPQSSTGVEHTGDKSKSRTEPAKAPIRIALFTVMGFAVHTVISNVVDQREDLEIAVVVTCPGPKSRRSDAHIEVVQALWDSGHGNIDVVVSNKRSNYAKMMKLYKIDMIISMGYPWLLPVDILTPNEPEKYPGSPRLGAVNFHNSLLPLYRGPNSFGWSICNGDSEFGFCSHRMDGAFDEGDILLSWTVPDDDINLPIESLMSGFKSMFPQKVSETIDKMIEGDLGTPQVGEGSHAPKFTEDFRWIDFAKSTAREVHNKVRAFYGERDIPKGALATVEGTEICIHRTFYRASQDCEDATAGAVTSRGPAENESESGGLPSTFFVKCKDTTLEILEWKEHASLKVN